MRPEDQRRQGSEEQDEHRFGIADRASKTDTRVPGLPHEGSRSSRSPPVGQGLFERPLVADEFVGQPVLDDVAVADPDQQSIGDALYVGEHVGTDHHAAIRVADDVENSFEKGPAAGDVESRRRFVEQKQAAAGTPSP